MAGGISEEKFCDLISKIGKCEDLPRLAVKLGFSLDEGVQFRDQNHENKENPTKGTSSMILKWRKKTERKQQRGLMIKALKQVKRIDVVQKVFGAKATSSKVNGMPKAKTSTSGTQLGKKPLKTPRPKVSKSEPGASTPASNQAASKKPPNKSGPGKKRKSAKEEEATNAKKAKKATSSKVSEMPEAMTSTSGAQPGKKPLKTPRPKVPESKAGASTPASIQAASKKPPNKSGPGKNRKSAEEEETTNAKKAKKATSSKVSEMPKAMTSTSGAQQGKKPLKTPRTEVPKSKPGASTSASIPAASKPPHKSGPVQPDTEGYFKQEMQQAQPTKDQLDPNKSYKMDVIPKGRMFIMNITKDREGSKVDTENIDHVFKEIGYEIESYWDLTAEELKEKLEKFANSPENEGKCSAVIMLMGHGNKSGIQCFDGKMVTTKYVKEKVYGMKSMVGKPRMIFYQCCRNDDSKQVETDQAESDLAVADKSDVLVVHATIEEHFAYRDPYRGSWFIETLCRVLLEKAHNSDLSSMLDEVTGKVKEISFEDFPQSPVVIKQGISKKIYFLPKYTEENYSAQC